MLKVHESKANRQPEAVVNSTDQRVISVVDAAVKNKQKGLGVYLVLDRGCLVGVPLGNVKLSLSQPITECV